MDGPAVRKDNKSLLYLLTVIQFVGLIVYFVPGGIIPAYITILVGVTLAFLFIIIEIARKERESTISRWRKIKMVIAQIGPIIPLVLILSSLIVVFTLRSEMPHCSAPSTEFLTYKWISYSLLTIQLIMLFKYLVDELRGTQSKLEGENLLAKTYNLVTSNLKYLLYVLSLFNALLVGFLYVIVTKFSTDG